MKDVELMSQKFQELDQTELLELKGGNPIINYIFGFLKARLFDFVFSPDQGSHFSHPSAPRNPDGMYICTSDNA